MTSTNPEAKFRRDAINTMSGYAEATNLRLDRTEQTVSQLTDNVQELTAAIKNQSLNIDRLERAVTRMVEDNVAQRETINNLIKLATAILAKAA